MNFVTRLSMLDRATQADRAAKSEALQRGLMATKPLTVVRLQELCALGEKMVAADRALRRAEDCVINSLAAYAPVRC
jgi:hypothetical protein